MSIKKETWRVIKRVERETGMRFCKRFSEPHYYEFYWDVHFCVLEMDGGITKECESFKETFSSVKEMLDYIRIPARGLMR